MMFPRPTYGLTTILSIPHRTRHVKGLTAAVAHQEGSLTAFIHPIVEDFGCEPARSSLPSGLPGTLPPRMPSNVRSSLVGRPTGRPEPESVGEWAPDVPRVGSPGYGWERPFSLATGSKFEIVPWEWTGLPAPVLSQELNVVPLLSEIGPSDEALLSRGRARGRWRSPALGRWRSRELGKIGRVSQPASARSVVYSVVFRCSIHSYGSKRPPAEPCR